MFSLIKQVLIVLLIFTECLARNWTKYVSLNDETCVLRPTLIDLNLVELKYYLLIINLDKCNRICNVLSPKICVQLIKMKLKQ